MKITEIIRRRGFLNEIRFDDGTYILLYRKLFEETGLKTGDDVSEEKAEQLENTSDEIRCKNRAMYYLSGGDYTVSALYKKLKKAGFEEPFISMTVERLKELSLLNDDAFAVRFAERCKQQNMSEREITEKAYIKGLSREKIKNALSEYDEEDEICHIKALLKGKYNSKLNDSDSAEKVIASLLRKGFNFSDIRSAINSLNETENINEL